MSDPKTIADSHAQDRGHGYRYFAVSDEIIKERLDSWSGPVQFRFETDEDDKVQMILRTVDLRSIVED